MSEATGYYLRTYSGRRFYLIDAQPVDIHIEDIAHATALLNRFGGHTRLPYSVAQHSVMIARTFAPGSDARKWALMHDAAETYVGDMIAPLKRAVGMDEYCRIESELMAVVCARFGLAGECPAAVKHADVSMRFSEQRDLMRGAEGWRNAQCLYPAGAVKPWPWWEAEAMFLIEFESLWPDWAYEAPEPPNVLLQVPGDDLLRLLQENAILREFRDETHRRETARVEASRPAAVPADRTPYDPADEWDEVDRQVKQLRGEQVRG